jgi:hypothetical protein
MMFNRVILKPEQLILKINILEFTNSKFTTTKIWILNGAAMILVTFFGFKFKKD